MTIQGDGKRRKPSLRGAVVKRVQRGQITAQSWPRPRGPAKTQRQQTQRDAFAAAQRLVRFVAPSQHVAARRQTKGTALYPRDLMQKAMRGTMITVQQNDGRTLYPMAVRRKVSDALDVLAQDPGTMLFRGDSFWQEIPPGIDGQVLVLTADGPEWQDIQAGGGSGGPGGPALIPGNDGTTSGSQFATKGSVIQPQNDLTIRGIAGEIRTGTGVDIDLGIAKTDGPLESSQITEVLFQQPAAQQPPSEPWIPLILFNDPLILPGGENILLYETARNQGPDFPTDAVFTLGDGWIIDVGTPVGTWQIETEQPQPGQSPGTDGQFGTSRYRVYPIL